MKSRKTVDDFVASVRYWQDEIVQLRKILCATGLTEEIKWESPCYTCEGKNVVGLCAVKTHFGLWLHQGALLKDDKQLLINAQQGKTRAL